MTRVTLLGLAAGLMTAVSVGADDKPGKLDPAKLVGDWAITESTKAGEKADKADGVVATTKEKMTLKAGDLTFVFGYKIDDKPAPMGIDLDLLEPEMFKSKAKGIVKLDGDKLTLCYHPMGGDRPKGFESTKENGNYLFVMKKKETKKEK